MIITCSSCQKKYKIPDERLEGKQKLTVRCPNCKNLIEAVPLIQPEPPQESSEKAEMNSRTQTLKKMEATHSSDGEPLPEGLEMPEGKRISLAVLLGAEAGRIIPIDKPLLIIGRENTDIILKDTEISRRHAQIEVKGNQIVLRDLMSTNGTFVNEQRITSQGIENRAEFRVGSSTLMLIVTDEE
jgi:predicted Zn finger-like uncharacterized protein